MRKKKIYRVVCHNPDCVVVQNHGGVVEVEGWPGAWTCAECEISEIESEVETEAGATDPCSNCPRVVCNCGGSHWGVPIHLISESEPCGQIYVSTPDCSLCSLKSSLVHVIMVNPYSEAEDAGQEKRNPRSGRRRSSPEDNDGCSGISSRTTGGKDFRRWARYGIETGRPSS